MWIAAGWLIVRVAKLDSVEMSETNGESWFGAFKSFVNFGLEVLDIFGIDLREFKL